MKIYFIVSWAVILHGCSTPETRMIDDHVVASGFPFIRDGQVTRSEIIDRLGQPASNYEKGMVVIYWLREDEQGVLEVVSRNGAAIRLRGHSACLIVDCQISGLTYALDNLPHKDLRAGYYNLVLVFDDNDTLAEHSLVFVR